MTKAKSLLLRLLIFIGVLLVLSYLYLHVFNDTLHTRCKDDSPLCRTENVATESVAAESVATESVATTLSHSSSMNGNVSIQNQWLTYTRIWSLQLLFRATTLRKERA